jgi:long-chain acyl-CoA synthetase
MTTTLEPPAPATTKTVPSRIRDRAQRSPDRVALREKDFGIWQDITWGEYWDAIVTVGHALLALGVEVGDRVAIQSENRPEWLITDMATVAVRGITMGLYPTNGAVSDQSRRGGPLPARELRLEDPDG